MTPSHLTPVQYRWIEAGGTFEEFKRKFGNVQGAYEAIVFQQGLKDKPVHQERPKYRAATNDVSWWIIRRCCETLEIDTDFEGASRKPQIVKSRQAVIAAIHSAYPKMSFVDLGRRFRLHHTTVMHAIKKVDGCEERQALRDRCLAMLREIDANA